jgi:hypothetical protein
MAKITDLRKWRNGEIFNARDYVYERDLLISAIQDVEIKMKEIDYQKIFYQDEEPEENLRVGDIWFDK